jgi:ferredoxin--NADP+ reductase
LYPIVKQEILAPAIKMLEVAAPPIAAKAQPGQFIILRIDERGERIPLTIADFDRQRGSITLIFQEVGRTTYELGKLAQGDCVLGIVGPLGMPSEIKKVGNVICIGGGVGIAPVFPIARALKQAGNMVVSIIGARSRAHLILTKEMQAFSDSLHIATDDGSAGHQGPVTHVLQEIIHNHSKIDMVMAIGPLGMMKAVADITRPFGIKTTVSLNPIMVDGTGMCGACRVSIGKETKFACVDGPEFDGHLVDWSIAESRARMFREEEIIAMQRCCSGGDGRCQTPR